MSKPVGRREFLHQLGRASLAGVAISAFPAACAITKRELIVTAQGDDLIFFDTAGDIVKRIPCQAPMHSITPHPEHPENLVAFEKFGQRAVHIRLSREGRDETRFFSPLPSHQFYGHGTFSANGSAILAMESKPDAEAKIVIRDAGDFHVLAVIPTGSFGAHDCQLTEGGKLLAVCSTGLAKYTSGNTFKLVGRGPSEISFLDLASEKFVEHIRADLPEVPMAHFRIGANSTIVAAAKPPPDGQVHTPTQGLGLAVLGKKGRPLSVMVQPASLCKKMSGEALSLILDQKRSCAGITNPMANIVTFWDTQSEKSLGELAIPGPIGITILPQRGSYAVTTAEGAIIEIDPSTRQVKARHAIQSGSQKALLRGHATVLLI
jgi:hypothetical protein